MIAPLSPRRFSIDTQLTLEKAVSLLAAVTTRESISHWSMPPKGKSYWGEVSSDGFSINRIIGYRNSFLPMLSGKFVETDNGVRVDIHMTFQPIVTVFLTVWSLPFILIFLFLTYQGITTGVYYKDYPFFTLGVVVLAYGMAFGLFWIEAIADRWFMTELFREKPAIEQKPVLPPIPLPGNTPVSEWNGIPIMPDAIAGEKLFSGYEYITNASLENVKAYYLEWFSGRGWSFEQNALETTGKRGSVLPNEKGGFIIYLGSASEFIYIYREEQITHVDIYGTT